MPAGCLSQPGAYENSQGLSPVVFDSFASTDVWGTSQPREQLTDTFIIPFCRPIQNRRKGTRSQDVESKLPLCHELPARHRGSEGPEQEQGQLGCTSVPDAATPHQEPEER